jgi:four helix bundle protein
MAATYRDLVVWQKSFQLTTDVYQAFDSCKDYGFKDQIQRASVSIMNNIAEGYARHSNKAFKNFLLISRGSAAEVESMLFLAEALNYINEKTKASLLVEVEQTLKLLTAFINKL